MDDVRIAEPAAVRTAPAADPLRRNLVANLAGKGWSAAMALVFVPFYIRHLGIEAYGLIGFFASLQAVCSLLDLGLGTMVNREMARLSDRTPVPAAEMGALLRTLEVVYLATGALIAAGLAGLAPLIAHRWLNGGSLPADSIVEAIRWMGAIIALRWPFSLYFGALAGLQRQVRINVLTAVGTTLANAGAAAALIWWEPTTRAFFAWQAAATAVTTIAAWIVAWRSLPRAATGRFDRVVFGANWRFTVGMSGISVLGLLLGQMDKLVLSRLLPLATFGRYALAATAAAGIGYLVNPIFTAVFPSFSRLVARGDEVALAQRYHCCSRLMAMAVLPIGVGVAVCSREALTLWTHDRDLARSVAPALSLLILGSTVNGLMHLPFALQLAHGWTQFAFTVNVVAVAVIIPLIIAGAEIAGMTGAAAAWLALNLGYLALSVPIMHRRLLPGQQARWYLRDLAPPLVVSVLIAFLLKSLLVTFGIG